MKNKLVFVFFIAAFVVLNVTISIQNQIGDLNLSHFFNKSSAVAENGLPSGDWCSTLPSNVYEIRYDCSGGYGLKYVGHGDYTCLGGSGGPCIQGSVHVNIYCDNKVEDLSKVNENASCN